jgi:hypothetical protein
VTGARTAGERRLACIGAVAWPSFFAAAVASMVFFAIVDPGELAELTWPHLIISRKLGYSIGFFMFWACTFGSSAFSVLLLSTWGERPDAAARAEAAANDG